MLIPVLLWSTITLLFIWRFRTIMMNMSRIVRPGKGKLRVPGLDTRPFKQLAAWALELWLLAFFYEVFGISIIAHLTATITALGLMLILRDKSEANWLRGLQVQPMSEYASQEAMATPLAA